MNARRYIPQVLTDPDQATSHLRILRIFEREGKELGDDMPHDDLLQEGEIVLDLMRTDLQMVVNIGGKDLAEFFDREYPGWDK